MTDQSRHWGMPMIYEFNPDTTIAGKRDLAA